MSLDFVGDILVNVFKFLDSEFSLSLDLYDGISHEKVSSSEMFSNIEDRWHLRSASLPGDLSICAIAIDNEALYIEAAPFDQNIFADLIRESGMPFVYSEKLRTISDEAQAVLTISEPQIFKSGNEDLAPRCLCHLSLDGLNKFRRWQAITLIDQMFTKGVFVHQQEENAAAAPVRQEMRLELNMSLIQTLDLVQRPMMSLKQTQSQKMSQNLDIQQLQIQKLLTLQSAILKMNRQELLEFTAEQMQQHGEPFVLRLFSFVLAGRVKRIRPLLTWKQARKIANRLLGPNE